MDESTERGPLEGLVGRLVWLADRYGAEFRGRREARRSSARSSPHRGMGLAELRASVAGVTRIPFPIRRQVIGMHEPLNTGRVHASRRNGNRRRWSEPLSMETADYRAADRLHVHS